jgi:hypothetical protein
MRGGIPRWERSLMCAARCNDSAVLLAALAKQAFDQRDNSLLDVFLLLHEMADFSVDTRQLFTEPICALILLGYNSTVRRICT